MSGKKKVKFRNGREGNRSGVVQPESWNEADRTARVVFATDAPAPMPKWRHPEQRRQAWVEVLRCGPENVRAGRANAGALQSLDSHNEFSSHYVLGASVCDSLQATGQEVSVLLKFRKTELAQEVFESIGDRTFNAWSTRYKVYEYQYMGRNDKGADVFDAVDWEPLSADPVPVSADYRTGVRSELKEDFSMDEEEVTTEETQAGGTQNPPETQNQRSESGQEADPPETSREEPGRGNRSEPIINQRAQPARRTAPKNQQTQTGADDHPVAGEVIELARSFGFGLDWVSEQIQGHRSLDQIRSTLISDLASQRNFNPRPHSVTGGSGEALEGYCRSWQDAFCLRAGWSVDFGEDASRQNEAQRLARMPALELGRDMLARHGHTVNSYGFELARDVMHTGSHFPILTGQLMQDRLGKMYRQPRRVYEPLISRRPARDYRPINIALTQERHVLKELNTHEGISYQSTVLEDGRTYNIKRYGGGIKITHEVLVNDNLGAVRDEAYNHVAAAIRLERVLIAQPIAKGTAKFAAYGGKGTTSLFGAAVGNDLVAADLDQAGFEAAEQALFNQKGLDKGADRLPLEMNPRFLIVPKVLENKALRLVTPVTVVKAADLNPILLKDYRVTVLVWSEMPDNTYITTANPNPEEGGTNLIEVAHLDGNDHIMVTKTETTAELDVHVGYVFTIGVGFLMREGFVRTVIQEPAE